MSVSCRVFLGLAAIGMAAWGGAQGPVAETSLVSSSDVGNPNAFVHDNTTIEQMQLVNGDPEFTIRFNQMWATFGQKRSTPQDWSNYNGLALVVQNLENRPIRFGVRADFTSNASDASKRQWGNFVLAAQSTRLVVLELDAQQASPYKVRGVPSAYGSPHVRLFGQNLVNRSQAYMWLVSHHETFPARVKVSRVRLIRNAPNLNGIVDGFGQTADRDWSGKAYGTSDLTSQLASEVAWLNANPPSAPTYGPAAPPAAVVPGKWSVTQLPSGKWYLVAPNGLLFWSFGITTANYDNGATPLADRQYLFQSLPPNSGPTAAHYQSVSVPGAGETLGFNFLSYNVARKYGASWQSAYVDHTYRRLRAWGFNTISDWANPALYAQSQIPYVFGVNTDDYPNRIRAPFRDFRLLPDPFGTDFQSWLTQKLQVRLAGHSGRLQFMGVYVDVELKWANPADASTRYNVALGAINAPGSAPAKIAFIARLKSRYRLISRLNRAWQTNFSSWGALNSANCLPNPSMNAAMTTDFASFCQVYADQYYSKVRAAVRESGCTGLYLGARDFYAPPEFVAQANKYVDVFSVALYSSPEYVDWSFPNLTRPLLISEMSFGASDRGAWHTGPVSCFDQAERAARMAAYFQAALQAPKVVGAHWFQYADQHPSGRNDGENYNMGFVSIADTPYQELVDAARAIGASVYATRGL